ncbi:MAG: hypothetical protein ACRDLB_10935 [Actinomycetota bacterium]
MEQSDVIWEGKIGTANLRVGVPHAGSIIAEWDTPRGPRHKVSDSLEEFERAVLFQLLLQAGQDDAVIEPVKAAVMKAQAERPRRTPDPSTQRRRKNPKARQHRRSRTPPRRR